MQLTKAYLIFFLRASKFAAVGLQEAVEVEMRRYGKDNIKFTVVCPMGVNTNLLSNIKDRVTFVDRYLFITRVRYIPSKHKTFV